MNDAKFPQSDEGPTLHPMPRRERATTRRGKRHHAHILARSVGVFVWTSLSIIALSWVLHHRGHYINTKSTWAPILTGFYMYALFISGALPVAFLKMRNAWLVRGVVFPGYLLGAVVSASHVPDGFMGIFNEIRDSDPVFYMMPFFVFILLGIAVSEIAAVRSQYPFSTKTNQWLRSFVCTKRFSSSDTRITIENLRFNDIFSFLPERRKFDVYRLVLYRNSGQDDTNYLWVKYIRKRKFFTLKSSASFAPKHRIFEIDNQQVNDLIRHLGPFKKTFFIEPIMFSSLLKLECKRQREMACQ